MLREVLSPDRVDFGRDLLPWMVEADRRVHAYQFKGYWQDVGTVESYWRTNLDLLSDKPEIELNDLGWLIYTRSEERPPARIGPEARAAAWSATAVSWRAPSSTASCRRACGWGRAPQSATRS